MYEFICSECEGDFERLVASADAAASVACPNCGSKKVHKKLSLFGVGAKSGAGATGLGGFSGGGGCCGGMCSGH